MQKDQFYPERAPAFTPINNFKAQYEGVKAAHEADLSTVENCFGMCNVAYQGGSLSDREGACLRKCYVKYFDSALLVEKEMSRYVHGQAL